MRNAAAVGRAAAAHGPQLVLRKMPSVWRPRIIVPNARASDLSASRLQVQDRYKSCRSEGLGLRVGAENVVDLVVEVVIGQVLRA